MKTFCLLTFALCFLPLLLLPQTGAPTPAIQKIAPAKKPHRMAIVRPPAHVVTMKSPVHVASVKAPFSLPLPELAGAKKCFATPIGKDADHPTGALPEQKDFTFDESRNTITGTPTAKGLAGFVFQCKWANNKMLRERVLIEAK